jgi:predicted Zn-dependent protease
VRQALEAASVGDVQRLESVLAGLPERLRNDPSLLRVRVQCAQQSGNDAAIRRAVEDFLRLHPNDPCAASLTLDLRIMQGDFAGAITSVDHLEQLIGRDPFFDLTRALMLAESGRGADARAHLLRAVQADPDFVEAWTAVLDLSTALDRYLDATRAYQALVRLSAVPPTFSTDPAFAQLRASAEFRQVVPNGRH